MLSGMNRTPRVEKDPLVPLRAMIPAPLHLRLTEDSERTGRSVSWIVRELLAEGMREMPVPRGGKTTPIQPSFTPPLEPTLEVLE